MRFDEMELQSVPIPDALEMPRAEPAAAGTLPAADAPRFRRLFALLTDLSLFAALALALSPLLPAKTSPVAISGLAGFVFISAYYYFVGTWLLWGKTAGGAIFDVRVVARDDEAMSLRSASMRFVGVLASLLTGGLGFLFAALPDRLSLPDRMSGTRCLSS